MIRQWNGIMPLVIEEAERPEQYDAGAGLFKEYAVFLGFDLEFQGFTDELENLPSMYGPPNGFLLLAKMEETYVGCVALRPIAPGMGEMKRMYVLKPYQGKGIGKALTEAFLTRAASLAYQAVRLDSVARLGSALRLYKDCGFKEIEPYCFNPYPDVVFMEYRFPPPIPSQSSMENPWLHIPASDYEGHMALPEVNQLSFLEEVFKQSLGACNSRSVACLGCSTGNGFRHIRRESTEVLDAIDINPEYLKILQQRYTDTLPCLRTIEADLNTFENHGQKYSLIFAGLIFEYLSPDPLLKKISKWLEDEGQMVAVLQLHDEYIKKVSETPYDSLKQLAPHMHLISEEKFRIMAEENGLKEMTGKIRELKSGKKFYIGIFGKKGYIF
ncbi:bifunctional GNAT family N-acetyltransferase/class I SAM-dependent methyltransferase [Desulfobotulus mexicanus]|uniref:GNAT family N-acetyltransferase n=1 Tax=Desulfobotulus mexicanus TaxID=2586642 RepID=A0A5Q4VEE2_9BACT|nr:bifunctional GNAT family N-acetyltransferase/class I SAM-dependent methyltransferase [Desulfobotulus mexicanus]TYT75333.1 GNAT family N-acetyltransferase [Desulfobotulus mexicanus]